MLMVKAGPSLTCTSSTVNMTIGRQDGPCLWSECFWWQFSLKWVYLDHFPHITQRRLLLVPLVVCLCLSRQVSCSTLACPPATACPCWRPPCRGSRPTRAFERRTARGRSTWWLQTALVSMDPLWLRWATLGIKAARHSLILLQSLET